MTEIILVSAILISSTITFYRRRPTMQTLTKKHWIALLLFITIEILRIIYCCSGGYYGVFLALGAIVLSWLKKRVRNMSLSQDHEDLAKLS